MAKDESPIPALERIAAALEVLAGIRQATPPPADCAVCIWNASVRRFVPVPRVSHIPLHLLKGIDSQAEQLRANTQRFAKGFAANNALLWGARGAGKSSLVKSVFVEIAKQSPLVLVEIHHDDLATLPHLLGVLEGDNRRFILFCDDLSFDGGEAAYKPLKTVLEGGVRGRPQNVLFYATSNRKNLMPRMMIENEQATAITPSEAIEEKVSLSDRFGLSLGFYPIDQDSYLAMIDAYAEAIGLATDRQNLHHQALEWAMTRGSRSGRVAWQFITDVASRQGIRTDILGG